MIKNVIGKTMIMALFILPLAAALPVGAAAPPNWNVVGTYQWLVAGTYAHDLVITTQNPDGTFSGTGGYPAGSSPYTAPDQTTEVITGQVIGDTITLTTTYNGPYNPGYTVTATGTIAPDGSMSGTSPFEWHTTSGNAVALPLLGTLSAEDFGVMNVSGVQGYTAGFGLTDATFVGIQSMVTQLYASTTLLQTDTLNVGAAIVSSTITGTQISSPFDVCGTFNYVTDKYWTNVRGVEYGQTLVPTKVVATATLANGKVVTAENDNLTGDPTTICPVASTSVQVHLFKYLDGIQATTSTTNNVSFPMLTTYNDPNVGSGTDVPFTLNPNGWTTGDSAYEASTGPRTPGSSASFSEDTSGALVGATCASGDPYTLAGYTTGTSLATAASSTISTTTPNFANLSSDEYVVVWNNTCPAPTALKVHILKYLDGMEATAASANSYQFPMTATWQTANLNGGATTTGAYVLGDNHGGAPDLYGADTSPMLSPANYTTNEITNDADATSKVLPIGAECVAGDYQLTGYQASAVSFADAANQSSTPDAPNFTGLTSDEYVIVSNITCPATGTLVVEKDTIGGDRTFTFTSSSTLGSFSITTASGTGSQTFNNVAPGTYTITETNIPKGWTQMENSCASVVVTAGGTDTCVITNTRNKLLGIIRGARYVDKDGDGALKDGDHNRIPGVTTIYLDTNNNGVLDPGEPTTLTNKWGVYHFSNLLAGTYYVREVPLPGWIETYPASGTDVVVLPAGKGSHSNDFGDFKLGTISGMRFNDLNGNGIKSKNEPGLAGRTITLTEPTNPSFATTTAVTDANGNYSFANVGPGTYQVREVQQDGWTQTTNNPPDIKMHSGMMSKNNNFGDHSGALDPTGKAPGINRKFGNR